jgi:CBS domain-containing protein
MRLMRAERVNCLPVVQVGKLVGIITERDRIDVSVRLRASSGKVLRRVELLLQVVKVGKF